MLQTCLKNENLKLHHSVLWLACFLLPLIPAIMGTFNYINNIGILTGQWYSLWTQFSLFYALFFYAPMIALYSAYLWRIEHFNHNWNTLMTMPVPVSRLCIAKLIILCKVTLITQVWMLCLFYFCGKLVVGLPGFIPADIIFWSLRGTLAAFAIGSLQLFLSMIIKNFAIPIGIALLGSVASIIFTSVSEKASLLWPYALMFLGMNSNKYEDQLGSMTALYFISTAGFFFFFLGLTIWVIKKSDI